MIKAMKFDMGEKSILMMTCLRSDSILHEFCLEDRGIGQCPGWFKIVFEIWEDRGTGQYPGWFKIVFEIFEMIFLPIIIDD